MLKKIFTYGFYFFVISIIIIGLLNYFISNISSLISKEDEIPKIDNPIKENQNIEEDETIETIMQFPKAPIEFLDEVLPELTPDPNREWGEVVITDYSKSGSKFGNFYVNDSSETNIDLEKVSKFDLPFKINDYTKPTVLIYHTHTTESYVNGYTGFYYSDEDFKNSDPKRSVVAIGEVMKESLAEYGILAIHDQTIHDSPQYSGSYTRSRKTIEKYLEENPSIQITIDLHRDSITGSDGTKYKPTSNINGQDAAQIMIITGADPTGELGFKNWEDNLIFATKIQSVASNMYEGLMRPLMFCPRKYNMDITTGSLLFEVGNEVNTFAEAKYSAKLMADVLNEVLKEK